MRRFLKELTVPQRLAVALDFEPATIGPLRGKSSLEHQISRFLSLIEGTNITVKLESSMRALDYSFISYVRDFGFDVIGDLKLVGIPSTLALDGALLHEAKLKAVTVYCATGSKSMKALVKALPNTEVLGVTILSTFDEDDCEDTFSIGITEGVGHFARRAYEAGLQGLICAPREIKLIRDLELSMSVNVVNVRPKGVVIPNDDQNPERTMTPYDAIKAGADRIIMRRAVTLARDPRGTIMRILDEIASAL
jgi:orotidine-5'-phosphate decarboxylase